ncbi:NAD-dependent histone deacetylase sir2 [Basidiobolus ranarum]|uniref:NAD-dependent histone deacetylase sir2 n=1 Tax=Basidiobolus ranarum TaxID=34480 RepID=A0ABR2VS02_9FUNG
MKHQPTSPHTDYVTSVNVDERLGSNPEESVITKRREPDTDESGTNSKRVKIDKQHENTSIDSNVDLHLNVTMRAELSSDSNTEDKTEVGTPSMEQIASENLLAIEPAIDTAFEPTRQSLTSKLLGELSDEEENSNPDDSEGESFVDEDWDGGDLDDADRELLGDDVDVEGDLADLLYSDLAHHEDPLEFTLYTEEERQSIRADARQKGIVMFIREYVLEKKIPVAKLLDVFDQKLAARAMGRPMLQLLPLLELLISRFLRERQRLPDVSTVEDVVRLIKESKNIMILTGAGVSVSCGIPDFRSPDGIYSRLSQYNLEDPQEMFDIGYFKDYPEVFYSFAKELYPTNFKPSPTHAFVKLVEEKGKLLRNYTQNIDTLEQAAGIQKVLQCHGSFASASCIRCHYQVPGSAIEQDIFNQTIPRCPKCIAEDPNLDDAIMKPDIVFFGEKLPDAFEEHLLEDSRQIDLLIVMGSSLRVAPVSNIMSHIPQNVPQILVNRTPNTHINFDIQLLGNCDSIVTELARMLDWELKHDQIPGGSSAAVLDRVEKPYTFQEPLYYLFEGAVFDDKHLLEFSSDSEDEETTSRKSQRLAKNHSPNSETDQGTSELPTTKNGESQDSATPQEIN